MKTTLLDLQVVHNESCNIKTLTTLSVNYTRREIHGTF
jgi:hypothetical protein